MCNETVTGDRQRDQNNPLFQMFSTGFDVLTTNTSPLDPVIMHCGLVLNDIILIFVKLNTRLFENLNLSAGFFSRLTRSPLISSGWRPALLRG